MGNIIALAIKTNVKVLGVGHIDPNHYLQQNQTKFCLSCYNIEHNVDPRTVTCHLCGGYMRLVSQDELVNSNGEEEDPWSQIHNETLQIHHEEIKKIRKNRTKRQEQKSWPKFKAMEIKDINVCEAHLYKILFNKSRFSSKDEHCYVEEALETAENAMTCSVCLDKFENPITLPCGHSVCMIHMREIHRLQCPICRTDFSSLCDTRKFAQNKKLTQSVDRLSSLHEKVSSTECATKK